MDWTEIARRKHKAALDHLQQSQPRISVPYADSNYTAPGWLFHGIFISCVPDSAYPWDPAVLKAIREFCPDAVPLGFRYVYQWGGYGQMSEPIVLFRHGLGRYIPSLKLSSMDFLCDMPSTPVPGCHYLPRPNYIENIWHDQNDRRLGPDLPGAYLPFDWEYYHALRKGYEENLAGKALARKLIDPALAEDSRRKDFKRDEGEYVDRDLRNYYSIEPSDVEWKEKMLGPGPEPVRRPSVVVGSGSSGNGGSV
jgi:hypothetical protein